MTTARFPALALDCCESQCAAALALSSNTVLAKTAPEPARHAETILPLIADLLSEAGLEVAALARLLVTRGPGNFTGVRTGLATARGLALADSIPVLGVSLLVALAFGERRHLARGTVVHALVNGRGGQVFHQAFRGLDASGWPVPLSVAAGMDDTAASAQMAQVHGIGAGSAAPPEGGHQRANMADLAAHTPALDHHEFPALPLYLRPADAAPGAPALPHAPR